MPKTDLQALKRRLSDALADVPGVAGVGLPGGKVTIYLEREDETVKSGAERVVRRVAAGSEVAYLVVGRLVAR